MQDCDSIIEFFLDDEDLGNNAECVCDESLAPSTFGVTCTFPECQGELNCLEDPSFAEPICAVVDQFSGLFQQNSNGDYSYTEFNICVSYVSGFTESVCYNELYDLETDAFIGCSGSINGQQCAICDDCVFDCSNLSDSAVIDDCTDDGGQIRTDSVFNFFEVLEQCFYDVNTTGAASSLLGDPHIQTFDGVEFDCQAEGDFVLVQS